MRIVIAPNSFKNCLGARDVAEALARGVRSVFPLAKIEIIPMSDGGDGLLSVLKDSIGGVLVECDSEDALMRPIRAEWLKCDGFAVVEMALASGLARLGGPSEYLPLKASTFGTGLLIKSAADHGFRSIIVGLGGSATVDAGCGVAEALGFRIEDSDGKLILRCAGKLERISRIRAPVADKRCADDLNITALVDVKNPLLGPDGAARVFAPQKGATPEDVESLDRGLVHWASIVQRDLGASVAEIPGGGAAGGLGAGLAAYFHASLESGAEWVAKQGGLYEAIRRADVVFTGEGRIDDQTQYGKVPACVARMAHAVCKPVIAFGGSVAQDVDLSGIGISRIVRVSPEDMELGEALRSAGKNLEEAAARAVARMGDLV